MLDGSITNTHRNAITQWQKSTTLEWSRCSNGIRLTCVVGSAPLMSMMRKLWRPSVASLKPTTKAKFPNNDIDWIHRPPQTRSMWRCNINSLRHIVTLPSWWPQNKYSSLGCMHLDHTVRFGAAFHAPNLTHRWPGPHFEHFDHHRQRSSARARSTHIESNHYALRRQRLRSGHHPLPNTSNSHPQLPVTNTRCGEAIKRAHINNWINCAECVLSTFAHNGHRSGCKGKWWG